MDCGCSFMSEGTTETDVYLHPVDRDEFGGCRFLSWEATFVVYLDDGSCSFYSQACNVGLCMHDAIIVCNKEWTLVQKCGMIIGSPYECIKVHFDVICCHGNIYGMFPPSVCDKNWVEDETCHVITCTHHVHDIKVCETGCCYRVISSKYNLFIELDIIINSENMGCVMWVFDLHITQVRQQEGLLVPQDG